MEIWKDLQLPFKGDSVIQMSAKDILGDSAEYAVGKNIFFRISFSNNLYSNKITLNLQQSAPHITKVDTVHPKCFGKNTGSAKIYFDRALKPTELLNIWFYKYLCENSYTISNYIVVQYYIHS